MPEQTDSSKPRPAPVTLTRAFLQRWPLPVPDPEGDKNERGSVLIIGGSGENPGAVLLAALAAMRSGAGRLRIATCRSVAVQLAVAVPEARVFQLPETASGNIDPAAADQLAALAGRAQAVLLGPGMLDDEASGALLSRLLPQLDPGPVVIFDAGALTSGACDAAALHGRQGRAILTPHAGEMAQLRGLEQAAVAKDPAGVALGAAAELGAVVALKGHETWIAGPAEELYRYDEGDVGLAMSGSGDVLGGLIAGLAARGAEPAQAAGWGVYLHGEAANRLARRFGRVGFLARELAAEVPPILAEFELRAPRGG